MSCPTCAERLEAIELLNEKLEKATSDVRTLERARTKDARRMGALEQQLAQKKAEERKQSQWRPVIEELFDYWRQLCGRPRAKLTDDRFDAVLWCLERGYEPERVRKAIQGAARDAFVNDKGKRFDDLELICRKRTKNIEDFEERAEAPKRKQAAAATAGADTSTPLERVLLTLRYEFGHDRVQGFDYTPGEFWAVCPLKPALGEPMRVRTRDGTPEGSVEVACAHGCDPEELRAELRRIERKRLAGDFEQQLQAAA